jgi:2-alkyl-3-oxoalkanoate reductase
MSMAGKLLITGATGGLGLALVEAACGQGFDVVATGRSRAQQGRLEGHGAQFVSCDLTDPASAPRLSDGCEAVIHAGALSSSWGPYAAFHSANVDATNLLLKAAQSAGVARFVYVSSPSIYAAFRDRLKIGSSDLPASPPLNHYAQTKLEGERLVLAAARPGFATMAIRPRAIVGPDDRVLLPKLAQLARRKVMPLPGGGQALIELTDVRDVVSACLKGLARSEAVSGRGYNISGGRPIAVAELAQSLAAALDLKPRLFALPLPLAHMIAASAETLAKLTGAKTEPLLTRYILATLGYSQTFDLGPAKTDLHWTPHFDGLATLLDQARRMTT